MVVSQPSEHERSIWPWELIEAIPNISEDLSKYKNFQLANDGAFFYSLVPVNKKIVPCDSRLEPHFLSLPSFKNKIK